MKNVLLISYYFPPSGGPGVQRVLKFVKYLPEFGWNPVVLTVDNGDFPARDESLLDEIPQNVKVFRTKIFEPYSLYRKLTRKPADSPIDVNNIPRTGTTRSMIETVVEFIRSTFFIPDARIGWFPYAVPAAMEIIRRENIAALYSSSPPYTCAVIAREVQRRSKLPWIAGFRDPWTGFLTSPKRWKLPDAIDRYLERSVYEKADLVETAWAGIAEDFGRKYPHVNPRKCVHLPNGFDPPDYPSIQRTPNDKFTITYTGSMYGARNPQSFLQALDELAAEGTLDPAKILVKFVGRFGAEVHAMVDAARIRPSVVRVPYLPHRDSVIELLKADLLLLIVDETKESAGIVPGKVFEYLGSQRPILALAPEGAVADIVRETRAGYVVHNQDVPTMKSVLVECYRKFFYHASDVDLDREVVKKYERKEITKQLAELLNYLDCHHPSHP